MEVQVSGRKVQLSPALREAVETKLGRLERFLRCLLYTSDAADEL